VEIRPTDPTRSDRDEGFARPGTRIVDVGHDELALAGDGRAHGSDDTVAAKSVLAGNLFGPSDIFVL
jgi:hypothetical protein